MSKDDIMTVKELADYLKIAETLGISVGGINVGQERVDVLTMLAERRSRSSEQGQTAGLQAGRVPIGLL